MTLLYILQAAGGVFGLLCWLFKRSRTVHTNNQELEPLLEHAVEEGYGAHVEQEGHILSSASSAILVNVIESPPPTKHYSYDWSIQFLFIVPISSFLLYNYGWLILEGLKKTLQESATSEYLVFRALKLLAVVVAVPYLPFIFKVNRIVFLVTIFLFVYGLGAIVISEPFTEANPLKLRFLQTIDLDNSPKSNLVSASGRANSSIAEILRDLPSVKESETEVVCNAKADGMTICNYEGLNPHLAPGTKNAQDLLLVKVLSNSSSSINYPFGMLSGKFEIRAEKNRECRLSFREDTGGKRLSGVVKTVVVYKNDLKNSNKVNAMKAPEGFSQDDYGNFVYKNMTGISDLKLNKLDWNRPYRIGVEWVASLDDSDTQPTLKVSVDCYWAEIGQIAEKGKIVDRIPAYTELLHYSPNYVTWANLDQGLVNVKKSVLV